MRKIFRILLKVFYGYVALVFTLGLLYIVVPPVSTLMLAELLTFNSIKRDSVPIEKVSRSMLSAVISAEDDQFCQHAGIDWRSMSSAIKRAGDGAHTGGASTIPMQVAKNLFLWPERSYIRKALEVPIALYLEIIWTKTRMMEVYLSIAEWGDGVFGVEAAAQTYFRKPASRLTRHEAALLAAALPNPLKRNPARPSSYVQRYANTINNRMSSGADLSCF